MPDHLPERIPFDLQYPVPFRLRKDPVLWSAAGVRHKEKTTGTVYPPPGLPSGCPWDFSRDRPWNFVFPVPGSLCDVRSGDQDGGIRLHLYPAVLALSVFAAALAVLWGVHTPVRMAAGISPAEAVRFRGIQVSADSMYKTRRHGHLFWRLAATS